VTTEADEAVEAEAVATAEPEVAVSDDAQEPEVELAPAASCESNIEEVCRILDGAERQGRDTDKPEGTRWIVLSDTCARRLVDLLRAS